MEVYTSNLMEAGIYMKLYLVERTDIIGYDEYDSHVILAKDVAQAVRIAKKAPWGDWTFDENCIVVERVLLSDKAGVIHSSFRAG